MNLGGHVEKEALISVAIVTLAVAIFRLPIVRRRGDHQVDAIGWQGLERLQPVGDVKSAEIGREEWLALGSFGGEQRFIAIFGGGLLNLRLGGNVGESEVSLNIKNATNAKPNLGDIGYVGYAQYNSAGTVIPMVATMQPRTIMLQFKKSI